MLTGGMAVGGDAGDNERAIVGGRVDARDGDTLTDDIALDVGHGDRHRRAGFAGPDDEGRLVDGAVQVKNRVAEIVRGAVAEKAAAVGRAVGSGNALDAPGPLPPASPGGPPAPNKSDTLV